MTDEQLQKYVDQLDAVDPSGKLSDAFLAAPNQAEWLKQASATLEGYTDYTDKYDNIDDFIGDKYKALGDLYSNQKGNMPSEARIMSFQAKHPEISTEEIVDWFNKTNAHKADIMQADTAAEGRKRRAKEIEEEWGIIPKFFASEYARQRYINEPDKSIFGKEGEEGAWYNRGDDISDLAFGILGAAGDAIPGPAGVFVGPAVRATRDAYHKVTDSKYQKDWDKIASDAASDVAFNVGTDYAPTFILNMISRRSKNAAKSLGGTLNDAAEVKQARQAQASVKSNLDDLNYDMTWRGISDEEIRKRVRDMKDGPMKDDLKALIDAEAPREEITEHIAHWESLANDIPAGAYFTKEGNIKPSKAAAWKNDKPAAIGTYVKQQATAARAPRLARILGGVGDIYDKVGGSTVKVLADRGGRGSDPSFIQPTNDERKQWYKDNYMRDWEMGFKPHKAAGDPLWEAYQEWLAEQNK